MVYIDPKDQPAKMDWPGDFHTAWEARRKLRLEILQKQKECERIDIYLELYQVYGDKVDRCAPITTSIANGISLSPQTGLNDAKS